MIGKSLLESFPVSCAALRSQLQNAIDQAAYSGQSSILHTLQFGSPGLVELKITALQEVDFSNTPRSSDPLSPVAISDSSDSSNFTPPLINPRPNLVMIEFRQHQDETQVQWWLRNRLFETSIDLFCVLTTDGYFEQLNPRWKILGYDLIELQSHPFIVLVHPDDFDMTQIVFQNVLLGDEVRYLENRYRTIRGDYLWLAWSLRLDPISQKIFAVVRDVTSQKRMDLALYEHERLLETAITDSPISTYSTNAQGDYTLCQGAVFKQGLWSIHPERGKNIFDVYREDSKSVAHFRQVLAGYEQRWMVYWGDRCFEYQARPLRQYSGKLGSRIEGLVGIVQEVTERHKAHQELQEQLVQQAAVVKLGQLALSSVGLERLIQHTVQLATQVLHVEFGAIWELLPNQQALFLKTGIGWQPELVGVAHVSASRESQLGYVLIHRQPLVIQDLRVETRFSGPPLLHNHRIVSGISVIMGDVEQPFGVLSVYSRRDRQFAAHDVNFLQAIANVLGAAIARNYSEEQLHLFEQAIASTSSGIVISDAMHEDNPVLYVNPAFEAITGYQSGDVLGKNCRFLQGRATDQNSLNALRQSILEARECNVILENYRKDGTRFWNNLYISPIYNAHNCLTHFIGVQNDITELVETEQALRESEKRLDEILTSLDAAVWSIAANGQVLYLNPASEAILGYPVRAFYENSALWRQAIHPEDYEAFDQKWQQFIHNPSAWGVNQEQEFRLIQPNGKICWLYSRYHAVCDEQGQLLRVDGIDTDISNLKQAEALLHHNAFYDALTNLPNRVLFIDRLSHTITRSRRRGGFLFAVLFLDLDGFKVVNDSLGHLAGDQLLIQLARRLESCLRPSDTLARLGGDEFTVLLEDINQRQDVIEVAKRIQTILKQPFEVCDRNVFTNASIGIALGRGKVVTKYPCCALPVPALQEVVEEYEHPNDVLRDADLAMYRAKNTGKGCYALFDQNMHTHAVSRLQLETDLRLAIEDQRLLVYYQPIIALKTGQLAGFEALVRWQHAERGWVSPGEFIPIAEETGLVVPMGMWVLTEACRQVRTWHKRYPALSKLTIAVNLSVKQFAQPDLLEEIDHALVSTDFPAQLLKLEITESAIVDNPSTAVHILQALNQRQISLCIDDFGTGYSSLSYLHRFPVNTLKVDQSFVRSLDTGQKNQEIVSAIVQLSHHLNMTVVAEGIETQAELNLLTSYQCDQGQGYYFARPLSSEEAEKFIARHHLESLGKLAMLNSPKSLSNE